MTITQLKTPPQFFVYFAQTPFVDLNQLFNLSM